MLGIGIWKGILSHLSFIQKHRGQKSSIARLPNVPAEIIKDT